MSPQGDDVDFGPWAAYCLGHRPYALLTRHMDEWTAFQDSLNKCEPDYQQEDPPELAELDDALDFLSSKGLADPVALNKFRKHREEFVAVTKEIGEIAEGTRFESEVVDIDSMLEPCFGTLLGLIGASECLIGVPSDLRRWMRLGAALGEYPLILSRWVTERWLSRRECFEELCGLIAGLAKLDDYSFLEPLSEHLARLDDDIEPDVDDPFSSYVGARLKAVSDLNSKIFRALRAQAQPEVWFDLDQDRLRFFGVDFPVDRPMEGGGHNPLGARLSRPEAAMLWVLAERVGHAVRRTTIRRDGLAAPAPAPDRQAEYLSRLRNRLRPAVAAYYAEKGWDLTKKAERCFILSVKGGGRFGPYTLAMDKSRVRLSRERPHWMMGRTEP